MTLTSCILAVILMSGYGATALGASDAPVDIDAAIAIDYCGIADTETATAIRLQIADSEEGASPYVTAINTLLKTGLSIADHSASKRDCKREFRRGNKVFARSLKRYVKRLRRAATFDKSQGPEVQAVQREISRLWLQDQAARRSYIELKRQSTSGAAFWAYERSAAHAMLVDARALSFMRDLLTRFDWIDRHRFGNRVSGNAWLLIQHADTDPQLQQLALDRMLPYLESDGVRKRDYAYLWDRVAVNHGRLQKYGTQPIWECHDGTLDLQPMEDAAGVNDSRRLMGLDSVESGLAQMSREVCGE